MNFLQCIESKRDGNPLPPPLIQEAVTRFTAGEIPDYQMSAFLMAVLFRGMNREETRSLTLAMRNSGNVLQWPSDPRPVVDKHSTGGVGDKVSLPLVPLLAALGFRVPMISGRGLGITGGTLDKLESIPGFRTRLEPDELLNQVQEIGCAMGGQTADIAPADGLLYALRDASGTVPSIPLITASILSKKLAENPSFLLLDVKFGQAAFMQTKPLARQLAMEMVEIATASGVETRAILNPMSAPTGRSAGNWLEVVESVDCLEGRGPADLRRLVTSIAAELIQMVNPATSKADCLARAESCLDSGYPREIWNKLLEKQGADLQQFERKLAQSSGQAPVVLEVRGSHEGFVSRVNALEIGRLVRDLGGGRATRESRIHPDVGVDRLVGVGDWVDSNDLIGRVHGRTQSEAALGAERLKQAILIESEKPVPDPESEWEFLVSGA